MRRFEDDEAGYAAWINENPEGFIANVDKAGNRPNYPMVHLASHALVTKGERFTTDDYFKVCSAELRDLQVWSQANANRPLRWCKICQAKFARLNKRELSNGSCEVLTSEGWVVRNVVDVHGLQKPTVRCQECFGAVRLHRAGPGSIPRAHSEHLVAHAGCSLGNCFNGVRSTHPEPVCIEPTDDPWSDDELRATVQKYLQMQVMLRSGKPFIEKACFDELSALFGRTSQAFEMRIRNISYVLELMGRSWIPSLVPATYVGAEIAARIEAMIVDSEEKKVVPRAGFEVETREAKDKLRGKPAGNAKPVGLIVSTTQYVRDTKVRAWVLREAKGVCECCMQPAPFDTADGPFLEVHHVRQLAEQGPDTTCNAVAICPNCHRRLHYGLDSAALVDEMYLRIARLVVPRAEGHD